MLGELRMSSFNDAGPQSPMAFHGADVSDRIDAARQPTNAAASSPPNVCVSEPKPDDLLCGHNFVHIIKLHQKLSNGNIGLCNCG